jgi:hypothetical protein
VINQADLDGLERCSDGRSQSAIVGPDVCRLPLDDLGDALVAQTDELGDGRERQTFVAGQADRGVAFVAQLFGRLLPGRLALGVVSGEAFQLRLRLRDFGLGSSDLGIVRLIPASRLA